MNDLPVLAILLLTYKRTWEALMTVSSTIEHMQYPHELLRWYVADDGSESDHMDALRSMLEKNNQIVIGQHNGKLSDVPYACGKGWNTGLGLCYQATDFVLILEDDWQIESDMDLVHSVRLLQQREDVGIVSFRILSTGADVHTVGHDGRIYLQYSRTTQYAYSGNPHIRHARYTKHYGWYAEDRNPGLIELHQDDLYRLDVKDGPTIWREANLDQWGGWHHIGKDKTWK